MNITACFLALIALAAVIFIHNLFLLRRCERLKYGQQRWRALAQANFQEAEELEGMLHRCRCREILLKRMLNRCREKRDALITQIWGSPTIARDLPDVYTIICELRERIDIGERTNKGLQFVITEYSKQDSKQREEIASWQEQARANAEFVATLLEYKWTVRRVEQQWPFVILNDRDEILGTGTTPEEALVAALNEVAETKI